MRVPTNRTALRLMVIVLALPFLTAALPSLRSRTTLEDGGTAQGHSVGRAPKPGAGPKAPRGYVPYKGSGKKTTGGSVAAVVAAYLLVWMILLLFLLRLHQRQKRLEKELDGLNRRLGNRGVGPDPNGGQTPEGDP